MSFFTGLNSLHEIHSPPRVCVSTSLFPSHNKWFALCNCVICSNFWICSLDSAASLSGALARFWGERKVLLWKWNSKCTVWRSLFRRLLWALFPWELKTHLPVKTELVEYNYRTVTVGGYIADPVMSCASDYMSYHCSHYISCCCVLMCFRCVWFLMLGSWAWWSTVTMRSWDQSEQNLWTLTSSGGSGYTRQTHLIRLVW